MSGQKEGNDLDRKRILVVEDSARELAEIKDMLEEGGYEVLTAGNSLEANAHIYDKQSPPHLILLDVMLPLLSGDRKVGFLKERETSRDIPVILMSVKAKDELREITRTSGADGYLAKPFTREILYATLKNYL